MTKDIALQHGKDHRQRILDAARTLFDQRGFHQTPMNDLAVAAQVSVGQIYRLFRDKDDVIESIVRDDVERWCTQLRQFRTRLDTGEASVAEIFEDLLKFSVCRQGEALGFDILAESVRNSKVGDLVAGLCGSIRDYARHFACAANPNLTGKTLDVAEELILACLFGIANRQVSRPKLNVDQISRDGAEMVIRALQIIQ